MDSRLSQLPDVASRLGSDVAQRADEAWASAHRAAASGIDRARSAAGTVAHRATDLGHATMVRVQNEPVKAIAMGALIGAAAVLLLRWLTPPR